MKNDEITRRMLASSSHHNGGVGLTTSRRKFLLAGASLAAVAVLPMPTAVHAADMRRSRDGLLKTRLRVYFAGNQIDDLKVFTRTYEGRIPGPTLRLRPGDTLQLRLVNQLPFETEEMPHDINIPHGFNVTNLHTHGLHVSPKCSDDGTVCSDNVLIEIPPGESQFYEITLPDNHPDGTYWFHPHKHGSVAVQFMGGMAGALIIEGDSDDFLSDQGIKKEQVFVLQQIRVNAAGEVEVMDAMDFLAPPLYTVNGQVNPIIRLRPGEVQRWRFIHAGSTEHIPLELRDAAGNAQTLHQLAADGITFPRLQEVQSIFMASGNRVDVLIQVDKPGVYQLIKPALDQGLLMEPGEEHIATVMVEGRPRQMRLPQDDLPRPSSLPFIGDDEFRSGGSLTRRVVFSTDFSPLGRGEPFPRFLVDDKQFNLDRVDQTIKLGAVEEWTVINNSPEDHPFHIHQNPFLVTQINEKPLAQPIWLDTVNVPRGLGGMPGDPGFIPGSVTFRSRFEDFDGLFVLHCHILDHEDLGMMQLVEVVR